MNSFQKLFYYLMFPIISLSYILTPLTNDARIYIAVEYIADKFYPYPYGWDLAWEIKPMANRLMAWVLYKIASAVVPIENAIAFGIVVKFIALCIIVAVIWYFARTVGGVWTFPLAFVSFTCVGNFVILQAEYWALVWSLLAIALLMHDDEVLHLIAGSMFVVIALFKGITGLLCISIICAVLLLKPNARFHVVEFMFGFVNSIYLFFALDIMIWPNMIPDILMSAQVARVGQFPFWMYLMSEGAYLYAGIVYIPLLAAGLFLGVMYLVKIGTTNLNATVWYVGMWLTPFAIIFTQGEFFVYHYFVLSLPTLITLILWNKSKNH